MVPGRGGVGGAGGVKAALSVGSGAPQQSWHQLMLPIAKGAARPLGSLLQKIWPSLRGCQNDCLPVYCQVCGLPVVPSTMVWVVLSTGLVSHAAAQLYSSRTSAASQPSTNSIVGCQNNPDTSSQQSAEMNQAVPMAVGLFLMRQHLP